MKTFSSLLLLLLLTSSCKKEVDPRDQYVATYKEEFMYGNPRDLFLTVGKGVGPDELRLKFDTDDSDFMARLTGSTFVVPKYERFYKDASGNTRSSGTVEGTGYFENKKVEFNVNTTSISGSIDTNKIVGYRVN